LGGFAGGLPGFGEVAADGLAELFDEVGGPGGEAGAGCEGAGGEVYEFGVEDGGAVLAGGDDGGVGEALVGFGGKGELGV
jgi:hypothetical protein